MIDSIRTTNGVSGADAGVSSGDVTIGLGPGGVIESPSGYGLTVKDNHTSVGRSVAIYGQSHGGSGSSAYTDNTAIWGDAPDGDGVLGTSIGGSGVSGRSGFVGVLGTATGDPDGGIGVFGICDSAYPNSVGVRGQCNLGVGIVGDSSANDGIFGTAHVPQKSGVHGKSDSAIKNGFGVLGESPNGPGVFGTSDNVVGVLGVSAGSSGIGVHGIANGGDLFVYGVMGESESGRGIFGASTNGFAVFGDSDGGDGVFAVSDTGDGLHAWSSHGNAGNFGGNVRIVGDAQIFGDLHVRGRVDKSGGSFVIDHPLDPANKYLAHAFVESPDMKTVYDGTATLDAKGTATVQLPKWFENLNRDYRYQLTAIGAPAPELHIAKTISQSRFTIAGGKAHLKVSWQVTGVRRDPWANANRVVVEKAKSAKDKGRYLHPDLYGQPKEKMIGWEPIPDVIRNRSKKSTRGRKSKPMSA